MDMLDCYSSHRSAILACGFHPPLTERPLSPHFFGVLVVTDLLSQNVPLEDVQYLAGTAQIYDRRRCRATRNLVERISV